jgi:hypothetical protein
MCKMQNAVRNKDDRILLNKDEKKKINTEREQKDKCNTDILIMKKESM